MQRRARALLQIKAFLRPWLYRFPAAPRFFTSALEACCCRSPAFFFRPGHGTRSMACSRGLPHELGDVFRDSVLYPPPVAIPGSAPAPVVLSGFAAFLRETRGVFVLERGASRREDGPMGKSARAFVFGVGGLLLGPNLPIVSVARYVPSIVLLLLLLTIIDRARGALAELRGSATR